MKAIKLPAQSATQIRALERLYQMVTNQRLLKLVSGWACLICLVLAGCTAQAINARPTATTAHSPDESAEARATLTVSSARALTPHPTLTPLPTRTPTSHVDSPLAEEGPWFIFNAWSTSEQGPYLWAKDANGELAKVIDELVLSFQVQPGGTIEGGAAIAYITQSRWEAPDLTLKLLHLPERTVETITPLVGVVPRSDTSIELAWSPDGRTLAFVSGLEGPVAEVYLYDMLTGAVTPLTTGGSSQPINLSWSPDGRFVIYSRYGFAAYGYMSLSSMWAVQSNGQSTVSLLESSDYGMDIGVNGWLCGGWPSTSEVLVCERHSPDLVTIIRAVNILTGEVRLIDREAVWAEVAYAPQHDAWLLAQFSDPLGGLLVLIRNGERLELPNHQIDRVWWSDHNELFFGLGEDSEGQKQLYTISPLGEITLLPVVLSPQVGSMPDIVPSPNGRFVAWRNWWDQIDARSQLMVGEAMAQPTLILNPSDEYYLHDVTWSPDNQQLILSYQLGMWAADQPDFVLFPLAEGLSGAQQMAWIP